MKAENRNRIKKKKKKKKRDRDRGSRRESKQGQRRTARKTKRDEEGGTGVKCELRGSVSDSEDAKTRRESNTL